MFSLLKQPLICRCCLLEQPPLYRHIHDDHLLAELKALAPTLRLDAGDGLTDVICDLCLRRLHDARNFQRECEHSELVLRTRHEQWQHTVAAGDALALDDVLECLEREVGSLEDTMMPVLQGKPVAYVAPLMETVDFDTLEFQESLSSPYEAPILWDADAGPLNTPLHQPETDSGTLLQLETETAEHLEAPQAVPEPEMPLAKPKPPKAMPKRKRPQSSPAAVRSPDSPRSLHPCTECEKKFTRNFQLKLHMIAVHGMGELLYQCEECHKSFASRHSLRYHVKSVHSTERPFSCDHCERKFVLRTQLSSHLRTHTGESKPRIFACPKCTKTWPTKSDLRTHMRSHDPHMERPFKCDRCEKSFFTRGHLSSHILVHTGEKPYGCDYCDKCYQSVGNLNNHMVRQHADIIEAQLEMEAAIES
ncbi:zinc finger protein 665 [Drosophila pseudoobscura]|uniref:Zinc finger protein 665 n=1 Tax=Drosophila pseudoobscura pseudoobscura TaxID=46245 RepID=A0A6I8UWE5_DROPS|nr:zinc finger protein 665 [Drosophila pseudoobscura]